MGGDIETRTTLDVDEGQSPVELPSWSGQFEFINSPIEAGGQTVITVAKIRLLSVAK